MVQINIVRFVNVGFAIKKMDRQGLIVTIKELEELIIKLKSERNIIAEHLDYPEEDIDNKYQINIINKTPKCSDTWEIEI